MKKAKQNKESTKSLNSMNIAYAIKGMQVLKSYILEPDETIINSFNTDNLRLGLRLDFSFDVDLSLFKVSVIPTYHYLFEDSNLILFEFSLLTEFEIKNLQDYVNIVDNEVSFPTELIYTLVGLSYSSARGVIFAKTQGSFLNQLILPFVDVKEFVDKKMEEIKRNLKK